MKQLLFVLIIFSVCGCSAVLRDGEDLKSIGIKKEDASRLVTDLEKQRPENLSGIHILQKKNPK